MPLKQGQLRQGLRNAPVDAGFLVTVEDKRFSPDSAVARWAFEQDLNDSWGSNDLTDNTSAGYVSGFAPTGSYAKDFDGSDDYAHADNAVADFTTGVSQSVACWLKLDDTSNFQRIINQNDNDNGLRIVYQPADTTIEIGLENSGNLQRLEYNFSATGTAEFLCLTKDSSDNVTLYRNDANQQATITASTGSEPINTTFGAFDTNGTQEYFDGQLDLVDVYSKELSSTEISNLYNIGSIE